MTRILVQCTFEIEVDWQDEWVSPYFQLEENGCPGTGAIHAALSKRMEAHEAASTCWACALNGKNKILSVTEIPD